MNKRKIPFIFLILFLFLVSCDTKPSEPKNQCAIPQFTPSSGTYSTIQSVHISCATNDVLIRYTTDGSVPTSLSLQYSNEIVVAADMTIKAKAFRKGWTDSQVASANFSIIPVPDVSTPIISPAGGSYTTSQNITITCETEGVYIHYTLDGSDPTESSTLFSIPIGICSTTIVKAKAFKTGWTDSPIASAIYTLNIPIPNNFSLVEGGSFRHSSYNIFVSSFLIAKYEVTQEEYQTVMGNNPSHWQQADQPIEQIDWFSTIKYCNLRSLQEGLEPCYEYCNYGTNPINWPYGWNSAAYHTNITCSWSADGYRLLTSAEWEFAARGGRLTNHFIYSGSSTIDNVAWYNVNSDNSAHAVGQKQANELGLFDMSGNVWEHTWDISGSEINSDLVNPHGATTGSMRGINGGSYFCLASDCTESSYSASSPLLISSDIGFRICRKVP